MKFLLREQSDYETDSYAYDSLEEALEVLEERKAVALEQGGDVGPLADDGSPGFVTGFRADYPDGGWWEAWIEVLPEEATPWEEVSG